jgi:hypothetical protein
MARFEYKVVADKIGNVGTRGKFIAPPHSVTIHHPASNKTKDPMATFKAISKYKGGYFPYHIYITDYDDYIYITQYLSGYTWHNSNEQANKDSIAISVDGNHQIDKPSEKQLLKLKQVLDDLSSNWFSQNGWTKFDVNLDPKKKERITYSFGKTPYVLHWHNEVAKSPTSCCGKNLQPYVQEYRDKRGAVNWGSAPEPAPQPVPVPEPKPCEGCADKQKQVDELIGEVNRLRTETEELNNKVLAWQAKITDIQAIINR